MGYNGIRVRASQAFGRAYSVLLSLSLSFSECFFSFLKHVFSFTDQEGPNTFVSATSLPVKPGLTQPTEPNNAITR